MTKMTKKYSVQMYHAQTNGLPYDLADVVFDGQNYAADEFDTLEEAQAFLAGEYPEVNDEQDILGRKLYNMKYSEINAEIYDEDGEYYDSEFIESNFDELVKIVKEMQASDGE